MANGFGVFAGVGLKEKRVPIAIGRKLNLEVPHQIRKAHSQEWAFLLVTP